MGNNERQKKSARNRKGDVPSAEIAWPTDVPNASVVDYPGPRLPQNPHDAHLPVGGELERKRLLTLVRV